MINWTNVFELTFWGCISIGIWEIAKNIFHKKKAMEIKNIKTSYGEFPTMIHYENYWKKKVKEFIRLEGILIAKLHLKEISWKEFKLERDQLIGKKLT